MGASEFQVVCMKDTAVEELDEQLRYLQHWLNTLNDGHDMIETNRICNCDDCGRGIRALALRLGARPGALLDLDATFDGISVLNPSRNHSVYGHISVDHVRSEVTANIAAIPKFSSLL
jgi:hypothetical protein